MAFEKFPAAAPEEESVLETAPTPEGRLAERLQEIIDEGQGERNELLKDIFTSRTADVLGNFVPGVDITKMTAEAIRGKTTSGVELSKRRRIDYTIISGGVALAYALQIAGMPSEALAMRGATATFSAMEFGPEVLKAAAEKVRETKPKIAHLLETVANYLPV